MMHVSFKYTAFLSETDLSKERALRLFRMTISWSILSLLGTFKNMANDFLVRLAGV